jgi:Mn2+/Fe2+ NRAMP family transporter
MNESPPALEIDRQILNEARERGRLATLGAWIRLSGPGWLQSAITLGSGTLAASLYLGVLAGYSLLWLQPLAMLLGIVMLSAIGYVTMSTGERPFRAINAHVSPVLGWGWAIASLLASMVWALPQYSVATAVLQQNLLPNLVGGENSGWGKYAVVGVILALSTVITWSYGSGGLGLKLYELILKILVGIVVICFGGVIVKLGMSGTLPWSEVLAGFIPDFSGLFRPATTFEPLLAAVGDTAGREFWSSYIVDQQRDVIIAAAATAVGINMTFLFPYSILRRGWGREFRGLSMFDLGTGMFIPFLIATSCIIISAATQFHARPQPGLVDASEFATPSAHASRYQKLLEVRAEAKLGDSIPQNGDGRKAAIQAAVATIGDGERALAACLVTRDAGDLAAAIGPLTGPFFAQILFGVGVLAMALSTITILMLISGFIICEVFDLPQNGVAHRLSCLLAATGALGPFIWKGEVQFWLAMPTSIFGFVLLPIAYLSFLLLLNQRELLGSELPRGGRRVMWNLLMTIATGATAVGAAYTIWVKSGWWGSIPALLFLIAILATYRGHGRGSRGSAVAVRGGVETR